MCRSINGIVNLNCSDGTQGLDIFRMGRGRPSYFANREEIATFTFLGVTERIIIGQEQDGRWLMVYLRTNGAEQATGHADTREEILRFTKRFMIAHGGQGLIYNLIQSSEIFLRSL